MKEIKFVPSVCKQEGSGITGFVMLRVPTIIDRLNYLDQLGIQVSEQGDVKSGESGLKGVAKMIEISKSHYQSVELVKADGGLISSFDEMLYESECEGILAEVGQHIIQGFKPEKNSLPS